MLSNQNPCYIRVLFLENIRGDKLMTPEEEREQIEYYTCCRIIFDHYGIETQKLQFIQELSELIQAITKDDAENFAEELADVQVMIDQFIISNPALDEKYQQIQLEKVRRQIKRINKNL